MKILRKINIGLVLTIIVVLAVTIYSINVEMTRKKEKENIKIACEEFIKTTSKFSMLPEEYQTLDKKVTEQELEQYTEEVKKGLKEKMINNNVALDIQTTILESELEQQISSENIVTNFEREILKINSYAFDGDQVTVTFKGKVSKDIKSLVANGYDENFNEIKKEETKNSSFDTEQEIITLQKIDNNWKVVYSDLQYSEDNFSSYGNSRFEVVY